MPTFDTPEPISVAVDLSAGEVRVTATERADTVVEVRPRNASHEPDVRAAEQTLVEYADGRLVIRAPKQRVVGLFGRVGSIDVTIGLPAGSHLRADASLGAFRCTGRLGDCRIDTSTGDLEFDQTGAADLDTGYGAVAVGQVSGDAEVKTGSGRIRVGVIEGTATVKNSNGDTWIGTITGDLKASASNGDITIDHANAGVVAATANGDVRVKDISQGVSSLKTACGSIEVGIHRGTAARLDAYTGYGTVRNQMDAADGPVPSERTAEVRARTSYGDIMIHHS